MKKYFTDSRGFTLVELSVVIVIIGVLAAFGVPKFRNAVERSKAAEAFNYLAATRSAQERYQARQGTYASDIASLDIAMPAPKYFTVGTIAAGTGESATLEDSWTLTLMIVGLVIGCINAWAWVAKEDKEMGETDDDQK